MRRNFESNFENKKVYLLNRIKEEHDKIEKLYDCSGYNSEFNYALKQSRDNFVFSAPEIVDYCFEILSKYISLDRDSYENPTKKYKGMVLNCKGEPIVCLKCKGLGHVSVSCKN